MSEVPVARPSSTVVLARETDAVPELLMVRRHERSSFGGAFAFPGGVLEPADYTVAEYCEDIDESAAGKLLGDEDGLSYFSAAIRELFEESGVLLAAPGARDIDLDAARDALNAGQLNWGSFVADNGLRLHCGELFYFSFWITPVALPKRYSTRFFLAAMPDEQEALHCGGELTESCWISAASALQAARDGSMSIHFPTIKTLEALAEHPTVDKLLSWAAARARDGVPCIFPEISRRDSGHRVIVSGKDAGELK